MSKSSRNKRHTPSAQSKTPPEHRDNGEKDQEKPSRVVVAEIDPPDAAVAYIKASDKRQERRDRWKLTAEWLTLFAVVFYGSVAYKQWQTTIRANRLTKTATENAANAFKVDERPWVGIVGNTEVSVLDNTGIIARVNQPYMNVGKTPALDVVALLRLRIGDPIPVQSSGTIHVIGPVLKECANGTPRLHMIEGPVALPNAPHATMISPENDVISRWPDIVRNTVGLYLTGCIDYDDVFGQWHRTHVCLYWSRQTTGIVISCSQGNEAS